MATMFEKRRKVFQGGGWGNKGKQVITFRTMAMVSKEELIAALNKHNTKPKLKGKVVNELAKRGVKLVWK